MVWESDLPLDGTEGEAVEGRSKASHGVSRVAGRCVRVGPTLRRGTKEKEGDATTDD